MNDRWAELEMKARAATLGPWTAVSDLPDWGVATENQPDFHPDPIVTKNRQYRAPWRTNLGCSERDAKYIAAVSPDVILSLIASARAYEVMRDALRLSASYGEGEILFCSDVRLPLLGEHAREALTKADKIMKGET